LIINVTSLNMNLDVITTIFKCSNLHVIEHLNGMVN